jgi:type I restriction enzyme M protein
MSQVQGFEDKIGFIWSVADLLRGDYKAHEYGQVILPLTVLRRLDCVLEPTKDAVVARAKGLVGKIDNIDPILLRAAGQPFYNISPLNFTRLLDDAPNIAANLRTYIAGYSTGAVEVLEKYGFDNQITRLDNAGLLYHVIARFADVELHPDVVSNEAMGYIFEELLRKFSEMSNETAGEHFTPREVIRLMVNILFSEDDDVLRGTAPVRSMYDPACGTGGPDGRTPLGGDHRLAGKPTQQRASTGGNQLPGPGSQTQGSRLPIQGQDRRTSSTASLALATTWKRSKTTCGRRPSSQGLACDLHEGVFDTITGHIEEVGTRDPDAVSEGGTVERVCD